MLLVKNNHHVGYMLHGVDRDKVIIFNKQMEHKNKKEALEEWGKLTPEEKHQHNGWIGFLNEDTPNLFLEQSDRVEERNKRKLTLRKNKLKTKRLNEKLKEMEIS